METIATALFRHAEARPSQIAILDSGRSVSYAMLKQGTLATASWLHHRGVRKGDVAALSLELSPQTALPFLGVFYALSYLGATVLPLYPDVPGARRAELVSQYRARWLIARGVAGPVGGASVLDPTTFDFRDPQWREAPPMESEASLPFLIQFTSGTTGTPKVCLFSSGQFAGWSLAAAHALGLTERDRLVPPRLWPDMVGMRMLVFAHLAGAAFLNVLVPNSKAQLAQFVRESGMTCIWLSPFQLRTVLGTPTPPDLDLAGLRALYSGGAFVSPDEIREVRQTLTRAFHVVYGSNEIGLLAMLRQDDPVEPGLVGRLEPDFEAQAVDANDQPLAAGTSGLLRFRSAWTPTGYLHNAEATARHFRDGWFYPGDAGSIDARGYVRLEGRIDDIINVSGLKIAPADVEAVLLQHPQVADAALVAVPDHLSGVLPVAFVVLRGPASEAELIAFCAQKIDAMRAQFRIVAVGDIPRSPDGKILRNALRDRYLAAGRRQ